jgi:uncharacterized membrane protein YphA (DoxX/SURF4 family)
VDTDGRYAWILLLVNLVLAAVATVVWSTLDRRRSNYTVMLGWLTVVVRVLLSVEMFYYGVDKVFPLQFSRMSLDTLATPLGATGHFGTLWHFMASSPGYTRFGGATEILGGLLLLLPELTPLGAVVCVGVMTNVFALNMFYDVTVKIISFHLLLLSLFLLAPYVSRLANVLVWNRAASPVVPVRLAKRAWVNATLVRWLPLNLGLAMLCFMTVYVADTYKLREQKASLHSDLYGVWEADNVNIAAPAGELLTNKRRHALGVQGGHDGWRGIIFQGRRTATIELQDGVMDWVQMQFNPATASLVFTDFGDASWKCIFATSRPSPDILLLTGSVNGNAATISLHREPESRLIRENGKFQWLDPDE